MIASLSPRIFLAFDDFSRAGKHVLQYAKFAGAPALPMPPNVVETFLPTDLCHFVQIFQYPCQEAACIIVETADLLDTQRWDLADALVSVFSRANVQTVTIVAALHLPYAIESDLNVFYTSMNTQVTEDDELINETALSAADPTWEVKDSWLAALLHLIQVEQWPRTHLLLAKGYKPGRDFVGTHEAVDALSRALQLFNKQVTIDTERVQRELPHVLTKETVTLSMANDHLSMLYH